MLTDFFKLNNTPLEIDGKGFFELIQNSKYLHSIIYKDDTLNKETIRKNKISGIKFENCSFSKTDISDIEFHDCTFVDCLFIGSKLQSISFHGCQVINCNFFKAEINLKYGNPKQFDKVVIDINYANIAVHFFQQLIENYQRDVQQDFKVHALYYFYKWQRRNNHIQAKRKSLKWFQYYPRTFASWLYDFCLGYGYKLLNLIILDIVLISLMVILNHKFAPEFFTKSTDNTYFKSFYLTITTMATIGASGYQPDTDTGFGFVLFNLLIGLTIFSATIGSVMKRIIR